MATAVGGAARPVTRRTVGPAAAAPQPLPARDGRGGAHQGFSDGARGPASASPEALGRREDLGHGHLEDVPTKGQSTSGNGGDWGMDIWGPSSMGHPASEGPSSSWGHREFWAWTVGVAGTGGQSIWGRQGLGHGHLGPETSTSTGREGTRV